MAAETHAPSSSVESRVTGPRYWAPDKRPHHRFMGLLYCLHRFYHWTPTGDGIAGVWWERWCRTTGHRQGAHQPATDLHAPVPPQSRASSRRISGTLPRMPPPQRLQSRCTLPLTSRYPRPHKPSLTPEPRSGGSLACSTPSGWARDILVITGYISDHHVVYQASRLAG